jgi:SOS response regulatory protein OraA/RecX
MILQQIRKSKSPEKIYLLFDNGGLLPLKIDDFVLVKIKVGMEIDFSLFSNISALSLHYLLLNYALNQIAISPKIESVLYPKLLRQINFYLHKFCYASIDTSPIIADIFSFLNQKNLLNPTVFAEYLIRRHQGKSQYYLRQLLAHHHLDPSLLLSATDDLSKIKKLINKKNKSLSKAMDFKTKNRLIGFLSRKGFAYNDIKTVIDEMVAIS